MVSKLARALKSRPELVKKLEATYPEFDASLYEGQEKRSKK
jgi:hypothetical protein